MTGAESTQLYPNLCLRQQLGGQVLTVCAECPVADPETRCVAYTAAQLIVEQGATISSLEAQNEALAAENLRLLERILGLKMDTLVTGMFTPEGLEDEISHHDPELAEKLAGNRWAVLQVDVRFLNYMNNALGQNSGDSFLQYSGGEISSIAQGLIRQGTRRTEDSSAEHERRTRRPDGRRALDKGATAPGRTQKGDILVRRGGDEFSVILLDIDQQDLPKVIKRWQKQLGVAAALKRGSAGIPFVGSVGAVHAAQLAPGQLEGKNALARFRAVDDAASQKGKAAKKRQYESIWGQLVKDSKGRLAGIPQLEDRMIAELFINTYFMDFVRDHKDVLGQRQD